MTPLRVWVGCLAFVAGTTVASACAGGTRLDDTPPTTGENRCGETGNCEGSATTEHPGCDVPGVAVFDLDGRAVCEGS